MQSRLIGTFKKEFRMTWQSRTDRKSLERTEIERVNAIANTAATKGAALVGLSQTLQAVNSDRVRELIHSTALLEPGFECLECFALFISETPSCAYCGSRVRPVSDVVERVVKRAIRKQAKVRSVSGEAAAALDRSGGIGALLKSKNEGG
jgi:peptide subunit release factor 1 (eRF1)